MVRRWKRNDFSIQHVEIWTRAVQGSAAVAGNAIGGVCHTFLFIETGPSTYLLERLEEGVKFIALSEKALQENMIAAQNIYEGDDANINSRDIAQWIEQEQKAKYSLINNWIHFYLRVDSYHLLEGLEQVHYSYQSCTSKHVLSYLILLHVMLFKHI